MRRFECYYGRILGSDWVIKMGVPALVGVCQQASSGGGGGSSFGFNKFTLTTASYGANLATAQPVPKGEAIISELNTANAYIIPTNGVAFNYSFFAPVRVNHELSITYLTALIIENDLPPDGECSYTITIQATSGEGFQVIALQTGDPMNEDPNAPVVLTFDRLNRSDIIGEGGFLPEATTQPLFRANDGEPFPQLRFAQFDVVDIDVTMAIRMADGSDITATQTMTQEELSCKATLV